MPDQSQTFRDFGIASDGLQPPPGRVRAEFPFTRIAAEYFCTILVSSIGIGLAVVFALTLSQPIAPLACAATLLSFAAIVYFATHNDYKCVELDGDTLRARHLYMGWTIQRSIRDIDSVHTIVHMGGDPGVAVMVAMLGRVMGVEIYFRNVREPLPIRRANPAMTNAHELIEAVLYRMSQLGELETDIVDRDGRPLVRSVHWKGQHPRGPAGKRVKLFIGMIFCFGLIAGTCCGYSGMQAEERHRLGSLPPQEISVSSLGAHGPGTNRHVILTDFRPGGYAFEKSKGSDAWPGTVWVALFPAGTAKGSPQPIRVVLWSDAVDSQLALDQLLRGGRIHGICESSPQTRWGRKLGPKLLGTNPGCQLSSAWVVSEMSNPPSAERVQTLQAGGIAGFSLALLAAAAVFVRAATGGGRRDKGMIER